MNDKLKERLKNERYFVSLNLRDLADSSWGWKRVIDGKGLSRVALDAAIHDLARIVGRLKNHRSVLIQIEKEAEKENKADGKEQETP